MYYDQQGQSEKQRKDGALRSATDPFDMSNLSSAYGPRTTETLIEAIFNPVPTHSEKESPFTYYVPLDHSGEKPSVNVGFNVSTNGSGSLNGDGSVHSATASSEYASAHSNSPSGKAPSLSSQSFSSNGQSSESVASEEKHKSWWRKIGHSRPATPTI